MAYILWKLLEVAGILLALAVGYRALARRGILGSLNPENTFSFEVTEDSPEGRIEKGGGGIESIPHNVSGLFLDDSHPNKMNWKFVKETPTRFEERGILFDLLGVQPLRPFRTLRTVIDRRFRYTRKGGVEESPEENSEEKAKDKSIKKEPPKIEIGIYEVAKKDTVTKYVVFSGEEAVMVKDADTLGAFGLDFAFVFVWERTYPVRAMLRVADANAVLTQAAKMKTNSYTSKQEPDAYLGGPDVSKNREKLVMALGGKDKSGNQSDEGRAFVRQILRALGHTITEVYLHDVDEDEVQRAFLELKEKTNRTNEANLLTAKNELRIKLLRNKGEANHIKTVVEPAAANERTVEIFKAEAYRDNQHVIAVGGTSLVGLPMQGLPQPPSSQQGRTRGNRPART